MQDEFEQFGLLVMVDRFDRTQQACFVARGARSTLQRLYIFGKTRTAVTGTRINKVIADAVDPNRYLGVQVPRRRRRARQCWRSRS